MQRRQFALFVGLALFSGCTSAQQGSGRNLTPVQYAASTEALKGSPALRRAALQECATIARRSGARNISAMGVLMNLPPNRDPIPLYCQRMVAALTSGRITYADFQAIRTMQATPKLVRVIQGR
jgi:hypothetical protein